MACLTVSNAATTREACRAAVLSPPAAVQERLNRAAFTRRVDLVALRIHPLHCQRFMAMFGNVLLNVPKTRNILQEVGPDGTPCKDARLLLLCPSLRDVSDLPLELRAFAEEHDAEVRSHPQSLGRCCPPSG